MKKILILMLCLMVVLTTLPVMPVSAANTMTVDCASVLRGATHCASGSLYGFTDTKPADVNGLVAPLKPYVFRNPARGASGNQHPFGAAIPVAGRLTGVPSAKISVDLADMLPNWPYSWPGMSSWLSQVTSFINDKKASGYNNWYGIEPWNEPDGTWNSANGDFNSTLWKQTYSTIRSIDPSFKIVGPCYSYYNHNTMSTFLNYCKSNNCLPDIISWHELGGVQNLANNIKDYRALETSLGINALPISINEYCDSNHAYEGQPGSLAQFTGKFERYKVDSACISWWFVPYPGRLGSLLATDTQKGAGWYFFKWYGDMTGNMVSVTPPNDASNLVDGAACVDSGAQYISFIFGGSNDGTISTTFKNIPSFIGSTASVKVEKVDWVSKDTVCNGTSTISTSNYTVSNGQITVSLTGCNASSGYRIYITPGGSSTPTPTPTPGTATATPTPTPVPGTATPTPTPGTATATPTPSAGTPVPGGIKVQFFNGNTAATTNTIYPNFKVVNTGTSAINLSDVKMRYYFTNDGTQGLSFACDYSTIGSGNVTGTFATITGTNADRYLEVGFTSSAGTLAAGAGAEVKSRVWKSDWSNFTQTNDYSFNGTATNYVDSTTVTGYLAGALKWGTQP